MRTYNKVYTSVSELASALRRAEAAYKDCEERYGEDQPITHKV